MDNFLDWLFSVPPGFLYAAVIVLSAIENVFPPVPADVAVALGAFVSGGGRRAALLGIVCWMSNTTSAAGMYFLARRHKDFVRRGWPRRLLTPEAVDVIEHAYAHYGVAGIFVSRFLPAVRAAVTPFAGLIGLSPVRVLVPAALASALWYALLVLAGTMLGREWTHVRRVVEEGTGALGAFGIALTLAALLWLWRVRRRRRREG